MSFLTLAATSCDFLIDCRLLELPKMIGVEYPIGYQLDETFTVLELKPKIHSQISCEAYLMVELYKQYKTKSEGFKDSLIIDGFNVCTYRQTSTEYPVYIKKIFIKKGVNIENFKVVLPKNYYKIAKIQGNIGILRIDDEIKRNFENFPGEYELSQWEMDYQKKFFEAFPDSSKTSLVFSNSDFLREMSVLDRGEYTKLSKCFPEGTPYSNFHSQYLIVNWFFPDGI